MNRDGYRDQIVTHDVGVSLHSKTHPLFMKYSNGTSSVMHITIRACFLCFFYNPYMSLFNSKNFSFTCNAIGNGPWNIHVSVCRISVELIVLLLV